MNTEDLLPVFGGKLPPLSEVLDDKQDAERFRWLLENCTDFMRPDECGRFKYKRGSCFSPREAIDKSMAD
jgi:hypothetical protein